MTETADYEWQIGFTCGWIMWPSLIEDPQVGQPYYCELHGDVTVTEVTPSPGAGHEASPTPSPRTPT